MRMREPIWRVVRGPMQIIAPAWGYQSGRVVTVPRTNRAYIAGRDGLLRDCPG